MYFTTMKETEKIRKWWEGGDNGKLLSDGMVSEDEEFQRWMMDSGDGNRIMLMNVMLKW